MGKRVSDVIVAWVKMLVTSYYSMGKSVSDVIVAWVKGLVMS